MPDNVKALKLAVPAKLALLSVDAQGFRDALAKFGTGFFRVVVRDRDAVNLAGGNYLPRRQNEAQASVQTSDIAGMEKYLLGRFAAAPQSLNDHADFDCGAAANRPSRYFSIPAMSLV